MGRLYNSVSAGIQQWKPMNLMNREDGEAREGIFNWCRREGIPEDSVLRPLMELEVFPCIFVRWLHGNQDWKTSTIRRAVFSVGSARSYIWEIKRTPVRSSCEGGLEYIHRNLRVVRGDENWTHYQKGITGPSCSGGYRFGDLTLQVGGVSNESMLYSYEHFTLQNTDPSSPQRGRPTWRIKWIN
jgi:hypothetical protein